MNELLVVQFVWGGTLFINSYNGKNVVEFRFDSPRIKTAGLHILQKNYDDNIISYVSFPFHLI